MKLALAALTLLLVWPAPTMAAAVDLATCARTADPGRDRAAVAAASRDLDARHKAALAALKDEDEAGFEALEQAYLGARRDLLLPLGRAGNANAVFRLSHIHLYTRAAFADRDEGLRLQVCAAEMGDPGAALEMFKLNWHDRALATVPAIQMKRAIALDWIDRALATGDPEGFAYLATYLSAGRHLYPISLELGGRLAALCVQTGGYACRRWLPAGAKVEPRSLAELMTEWRAIREEILANDCPTSRCDQDSACRCD